MGTTHSVSKHAEAIVTDSGEIFYALFEGTFESNVYPHEARVSCIGFGKSDYAMKRVISHAASCEGGGLKGVSKNYIKPESYIRQWRKALANPIRLTQNLIKLPFGTGWRCISEKLEPQVRELMTKYGFSGKESFNLTEPNGCELLSAIVNLGVSAWILLPNQSYGEKLEGLGYPIPKKSKINPILVEVYKLPDERYPNSSDHDHMFRIVEDGRELANTGWAYQTMYQFIIHGVIQAENANPGCAEFLIGTFRDQLLSAPVYVEIKHESAASSPDVDPRQMDLLATI